MMHRRIHESDAYPTGVYKAHCKLYSIITLFGGLKLLYKYCNQYRQSMRKKNNNTNNTQQQSNGKWKMANTINTRLRRNIAYIEETSSSLITTIDRKAFSECNKIHYDPGIHNKDKKMQVGNKMIGFDFHPTTNRTSKGKPRPLLFEDLVNEINPVVIDPSLGDVVRVPFPSEQGEEESECVVFYAHDNSQCDALANLNDAAFIRNHGRLDKLLDAIPPSLVYPDHLAGMWYYAYGFGMQGEPTGTPSTLLTHECTKTTNGIMRIVSELLQSTASCILKYCPNMYHANQLLKDSTNTNLACPPLQMQDKYCHWFANQFAIRQVGYGLNDKPIWANKEASIDELQDENIIALHTDAGDYCTYQPLIYVPYGGNDGVGGNVNKSDLLVCQNKVGGYSVRIKTNIPNTVVVVLMNSNNQLHGLVHDRNSPSDLCAWSTRIIPFITNRAHQWMTKHPTEMPFDRFGNYF